MRYVVALALTALLTPTVALIHIFSLCRLTGDGAGAWNDGARVRT